MNETHDKATAPQERSQEQQAQTDRKTQVLSPDVRARNSCDPRDHCCDSREQYPKTKLLLNIILTAATVGAFVAACRYAYLAGQQLDQMKNSVIQQTDATNAANKQASAAITQAAIADETMRVSNRAFLYINEVTIGGGGPDGKGDYVIKIDIANSGPTQARQMVLTDGMGTIQGFPPPDWEPGNEFIFTESTKSVFGLVPPKEHAQSFIAIHPDLVNEIKAHTNSVVIFGTIRYCDTFKAIHMTRFCQKFEFWTIDSKHDNQESFLFGPCTPHSCDDEDCPDYDPKDNAACVTPSNK